MLRFFYGDRQLSTAKTIFWKRSGLLMSLRFGDCEGRSEIALKTLSKYMPGDGNRLPDLVAAISELRHSATFAAPGAIVVLSNVRMGRKHTS